MAGKKGNKKGKQGEATSETTLRNDNRMGLIHETLDIFARIMQEVTGAGYSHKEAEEAFNALWSEGYDFEDVEKSVQLLIERLGVGIGWGAERTDEESGRRRHEGRTEGGR